MSRPEPHRIDAIKHILATLFAAQNALKALAPEYKWAGMGNLLGDYGEFVCVAHYGLDKAPPGSNGYDAIMPDGRTVQIKTCYASGQIGFRGEADMLLVIQVDSDGAWEEVYFGPFAPVLDQSRYSARDNKQSITLTKLKAINS